MNEHYDPSASVVQIQKLAVELRALLAPAFDPDYKRVAEVVNDLRLHTSDVRSWVYQQFPDKGEQP